MHNVVKVTTLWLLSGYHAPLTAEHFNESNSYADTVVGNVGKVAAVEAWLAADITNQIAAVTFMHNYWHVTFNCGTPESLLSAPNVPAEHTHVLMALVNEVSTMP